MERYPEGAVALYCRRVLIVARAVSDGSFLFLNFTTSISNKNDLTPAESEKYPGIPELPSNVPAEI